MGVLRTNEDTFEDQANVNNFVTDQHHEFSIPTRGASSFYPILPKNYFISQILETDEVMTLASDSTEDGIIQVFKAVDGNNINGLRLVANASHPATRTFSLIDDFEYTSSSALRAVWQLDIDDEDDLEIYTNSSNEDTGQYCMKIDCDSDAEGSSFYKVFSTPEDWSHAESIHFRWQQTSAGSYYRWRLKVHDSAGQTAYTDFNAVVRNMWESKELFRELFNNKDIIDWADIVKIEFYSLISASDYCCYLDSLQVVMNDNTSHVQTTASLIHFGAAPDFTTIGDIKTLDDNADTEPLIVGTTGKRIVHLGLQYGAATDEWKLIDGDYYGVYIRKPDVGTITFYGTGTQTFAPGNLYTTTAGALTPLNKSLGFMFNTFSKSTLKKLKIRQDVHSPDSTINVLLVDPVTFKVKQFLGVYTFDACEHIEINFDYSNPEIIVTDSTSHLYVYYEDSKNSNASALHVCPRFHYAEIGEE